MSEERPKNSDRELSGERGSHLSPEQIEKLAVTLATHEPLKSRARRPSIMVITLLVIAFALVAVSLVLVYSLPSGTDLRSKVEARECRSNLERIEEAVDDYQGRMGEPPPAGILDSSHPLVTEGFLPEAPTCPSDDSFYQIFIRDSTAIVECVSGGAGHSLKK